MEAIAITLAAFLLAGLFVAAVCWLFGPPAYREPRELLEDRARRAQDVAAALALHARRK